MSLVNQSFDAVVKSKILMLFIGSSKAFVAPIINY